MVQKRKRKRCDFKRYRIDVELYATQSWTDWSTLRTTAILEQSAGLTREQGLALSLKKGKGHRAIRLRVQTGYARSVIRGSSRPRGPDPPRITLFLQPFGFSPRFSLTDNLVSQGLSLLRQSMEFIGVNSTCDVVQVQERA